MKVHLVCGYRRTGKDTLAKYFTGETEWSNFNWSVFRHPECYLIFEVVRCQQVSFARKLKEHVLSMLNLSPDLDVEQMKDVLIVDGKLLRHHFMDYAMEKRLENIDYWAELAFSGVSTHSNVVVSDWRFVNEFE